MLVGQYATKLTEKGRAAMPVHFRRQIGDAAIIAKWYEGCLVVVSQESWQELLQKLTGKSEIITAPVRDTDRFILGSAFEFTLDEQGRFVIPKLLRDYARLDEDIIFVGLGNRIEMWNKTEWEEREKYVQEHAGEMIEKLADQTRT